MTELIENPSKLLAVFTGVGIGVIVAVYGHTSTVVTQGEQLIILIQCTGMILWGLY